MSDAVKRNYDFDSFIKDMKLEGYEFAKVEDLPCILHPNFSKAIPLALQKYSILSSHRFSRGMKECNFAIFCV